jgi:predicted MPP superfamily phosphohydrolase
VSLIDEEPAPPPSEPERLMQPYWPLRLAGGLLLILAVYGFWYEPDTLRAVEYPVRIEGGIGGALKIAVIADLHGGAPYITEEKIERVVALANAAKPDLVLLTGDYVVQGVLGGWHMPIETIAAKLKGLHARLGVYAVLGNHDHWGDGAHIAKVLGRAGIVVLEDRAARIGVGGNSFYLAGISDYASGEHLVGGAMLGIPDEQKALCFTHSPDVFPEVPRTCVLTIAGHTHGGQVRLPWIGSLIVPSRYGQRYVAGLVEENEHYLFVSTGIGTSILPVRFGVRPEVSILDVR